MKNSKILKSVLSYIGRYKYLVFISILCAVASSLSALYIPILAGRAIDFIVAKGRVDFASLKPILIEIVVIAVITAFLQWLLNVLNNRVTFNVVRDMRRRAFEKIERLPFKYLDSHQHGETVSKVISDADQLADGLLMGFTQFFTGVVTIIGTLGFMIYINLWIALVVVVLTPLSFFLARFIATKTYKMFKLQSETRGEQTAFVNEMITNQKVTEAYGHADANMQRFDEINEKLAEYSLKATFYSSITNPGTRFVNAVVYAAVALFGAILALNGGITVGILSSFLAYSTQYTKPFNEISGVITELQNAIACAGRLIDLIEEDEVDYNEENGKVLETVSGDITLSDVSFGYTEEKTLINDFNLSVKSGMKVAIVGPTGSGKTTLINLLMKFYDIRDGSICLDGDNYNSLNVKSLRSEYGMVLQETWLKSGTVLDNIRLGKPDATIDEVVEAAKKAHSHSFIKRLPDGYNTVLGSDGGGLSHGQRQLLCITRLMLANPPLLILDEATSSIDTRTEMRIQKAFDKLMQGKTTFIVAHRLSTIVNADLILVMNNGEVIEQGNHKDLLDKKGFYYKLYNSQYSNFV